MPWIYLDRNSLVQSNVRILFGNEFIPDRLVLDAVIVIAEQWRSVDERHHPVILSLIPAD